MKSQIILLMLATALMTACSGTGSSKVEINSELDSVCYLLGHAYGEGMTEQSKGNFPGGDINVVEFLDGFVAGVDSVESKIEVESIQGFLQKYATDAQAKDSEIMAQMDADSTLDLPKYVSPALDSACYVYGYMTGKEQFRAHASGFPGGPMNLEAVKQGFIDGANGVEAMVVVEDSKAYLQNYFGKAQVQAAAAEEAAAAIEAAPKLEEVAKFMDENGKRSGVVTDESGKFQYEVLKQGNGPKPSATDKVTVHYHGTLLDGTVFDSSVERGEPASFGLNQVIKGWTEGVQLMPTGSKYKFFIHPDYAYGHRGRPGIPGSSLLIFEVELLSIDK